MQPWNAHAPIKIRQAYWKDLFESGRWRCNECAEELPLSEFMLRRSGRGAGKPVSARCRSHHLAAQKSYRQHNNAYGVNYHLMYEQRQGRCDICQIKFEVLAIDHDHRCCEDKRGSCGECVRGLLCPRCNSGIAMLRDDVSVVRRAADYLAARQELPRCV